MLVITARDGSQPGVTFSQEAPIRPGGPNALQNPLQASLSRPPATSLRPSTAGPQVRPGIIPPGPAIKNPEPFVRKPEATFFPARLSLPLRQSLWVKEGDSRGAAGARPPNGLLALAVVIRAPPL